MSLLFRRHQTSLNAVSVTSGRDVGKGAPIFSPTDWPLAIRCIELCRIVDAHFVEMVYVP
jgi:hypothetical protein